MDRNRLHFNSSGKGGFSTFVTVFIVVLFLVAAYCAGYYMGSHFDITVKNQSSNGEKSSDTKEKQADKNVIEYSLTDSKIANLIPNLVKGINCWTIEEFANDRRIVSNDIPNQRAYIVAEVNTFYPSGRQSVTLEEYTNEVRKFFGKNYQFDPELVRYNDATCPQYEYQKESRQFIRRQTSCGGTCGPNKSIFKVIRAVDTDGVLVMDVKVLFGSREGTNFYRDYQKTKLVTNDPNTLDSSIGQGGEYKFTFKNENDNYVFVSSEPVS